MMRQVWIIFGVFVMSFIIWADKTKIAWQESFQKYLKFVRIKLKHMIHYLKLFIPLKFISRKPLICICLRFQNSRRIAKKIRNSIQPCTFNVLTYLSLSINFIIKLKNTRKWEVPQWYSYTRGWGVLKTHLF